ncbi:transposase [Dyadobacter flavalbus]|uniref:Transposase n=1 Tax=Dyadobacter flavalbus TaxID=2579942 RepID=A0A5M8QQI3_9BACT|nr:transposase [Dyadobacter flavalbus]
MKKNRFSELRSRPFRNSWKTGKQLSRLPVNMESAKPLFTTTRRSPELISIALTEWCESNETALRWIQPGKPAQNGYIERFNGTFRREVLNAYLFRSLQQVREVVDRWINDYNTQRPHQALGFLIPNAFRQTG